MGRRAKDSTVEVSEGVYLKMMGDALHCYFRLGGKQFRRSTKTSDLREVTTSSLFSTRRIVVIDEADGMSQPAQYALRSLIDPRVEASWLLTLPNMPLRNATGQCSSLASTLACVWGRSLPCCGAMSSPLTGECVSKSSSAPPRQKDALRGRCC